MRLSGRILKPLTIFSVTLATVLAGSAGADINSPTSISQTSGNASQSSGSPASTTLKPSTCKTETLTKMGALCYEFTGQENWDHPNGKTVTLPVAVLPGSDPTQAPVFYLTGGPGGSTMASNEATYRARLETIKPRSLVLVEQRGHLHARPALDCPEFYKIHFYHRQFAPIIYDPKSLNKRIKQMADHVKGCYSKLTSEGIDVTQYTDYQITRDFDEIRKALGYDTINLWGKSAGTGTVETYARYYGSHTRAAISEAPWYSHLRNRPQIDEFYTEKQAINDVLGICVRDNEECARRFPDYMMRVDRARAILDAKPYNTSVTTEAGGERRIRIDGAAFLIRLRYNSFEFRYHLVPKVLEAIEHGDYAALDEFFSLDDVDTVRSSSSWIAGHMWAVTCGDMGKNRPTPEESLAMIKREPAMMGYTLPVWCAWWGEDGDVPTSMNTAPVSDVPLLAIQGQMDTCCTTKRSELMAKTMPNLQSVEIQAQGHDLPRSSCRSKLMSAFLNSPNTKVDDSCKDDIPLRPWEFYEGD